VSCPWIQESPLHVAANRGHTGIVDTLLGYGANPNAFVEYSCPPLHIASERGHEGVVRLLLRHGAQVNAQDHFNRTAFHYASDSGNSGVMRILHKFGAQVDAQDEDGRTALHEASSGDELEVLQLLIELGADIELPVFELGQTALQMASKNDERKVVRTLLEHGADVAAHAEGKLNALQLASKRGDHTRIVRLLLKAGANIEVGSDDSCSPLSLASYYGHHDVLRVLLDHGADARPNGGKNSAFNMAIKAGDVGVIKCLMDTCLDQIAVERVNLTLFRSELGGMVVHFQVRCPQSEHLSGNEVLKLSEYTVMPVFFHTSSSSSDHLPHPQRRNSCPDLGHFEVGENSPQDSESDSDSSGSSFGLEDVKVASTSFGDSPMTYQSDTEDEKSIRRFAKIVRHKTGRPPQFLG
jgi:ankyrin repeat protein